MSKFPRIHPGASGVAVLEHLERLDAVEAGLQRLGSPRGDVIEEEEGEAEEDNGNGATGEGAERTEDSNLPVEPEPGTGSGDPGSPSEGMGRVEEEGESMDMSMSLPFLGRPAAGLGQRDRRSFDWLPGGTGTDAPRRKTVIVEVCVVRTS